MYILQKVRSLLTGLNIPFHNSQKLLPLKPAIMLSVDNFPLVKDFDKRTINFFPLVGILILGKDQKVLIMLA